MLNIFNFFKRFQYLLPLFFVAVYFIFVFLVRREAPSTQELIYLLKSAYEKYGYLVVFVGGMLEGNFLLGFYVPGSTMMLLGAAFAKEGIVQLPYVLLSGTLGLTIAYCINYFFGKHGWHHILIKLSLGEEIDIAKQKIQQHGAYAFLLGYFSPGSAAFLSTAAGVTGMPFRKFLLFSLLGQILWSVIWGSMAYAFGMPLVELILRYFIFVTLIFATFWLIRKYVKRKT